MDVGSDLSELVTSTQLGAGSVCPADPPALGVSGGAAGSGAGVEGAQCRLYARENPDTEYYEEIHTQLLLFAKINAGG